MNTPMHCTDEDIHNLVERGLLPQGTKTLHAKSTERDQLEHPTASWLYRKCRAGSVILTKDEAYRIGNQLDAQAARIRELESGVAEIRRTIRAGIESLGSMP